MRQAIAAALLAVTAAIPSAYAGPHMCLGSASDATGNRVGVGITLKKGVDIRYIEAHWFVRPIGSAGNDPETDLEIGYESTTLEALGPPTSVTFNFGALGRRDFDSFSFALDSGRTWEAGYTNRLFSQISVRPAKDWFHDAADPLPPDMDDHGVNADLMDALEAARSAKMLLHSADPTQSLAVDFDLSDHAGRDALFARAVAEARGKMKTLEDCPEAYGGPPE